MRRIAISVFVSLLMVSAAAADGLPPFRINYEAPIDGLSGIVIDDADGVRVRNVEAEIERSKGHQMLPWDLKDDHGNYVEPGTYQFRTLMMPRPELYYQYTPYPNMENFWDDRLPWYTSQSGPHGWGSDNNNNSMITTRADRVYFGSWSSEAGQAFTEIDLDGKKHWGHHWFGPFLGVQLLAAEEDAVYICSHNRLFRKDAHSGRVQQVFTYYTAERRGWPSAMAARDGKVYMGFSPIGGADLFDNVTTSQMVDLDNCMPVYDQNPPMERVRPNPRQYFLRALRLTWTPPGMGNPSPRHFHSTWPAYVQTPPGTNARQHTVVAFHQDTPIGSIAFPYPHDPEWIKSVEFSTLKPGAPYPPRPDVESDWVPFTFHGKPGTWNVIAAPEGTMTRALRVSFNRSDALAADAQWHGWLEGMKMLNRRFNNHTLHATIRVNSGVVDEFGDWDAKRELPISRENPGIFVMEWRRARSVSGLAIKEIHGAVTEIDVWEGPEGLPVSLENDEHWRKVATYNQQRRDHYGASVDHVHNGGARYIDGYIDIRGRDKLAIETRAIRLRVVEQWLEHGHRSLMGIRNDHGGRVLDTRRCRIFGVAALEHIGGEPLIDNTIYQRLAVHDGQTGALIREFPLALGWRSLHFHPDGRLLSLDGSHTKLVEVNPENGRTRELFTFEDGASQISFGPDGLIYAYVGNNRDEDARPFRVYDMNGRLLKEFGTPGRIVPGSWVPSKVGTLNDMTVDSKGNLWVAEGESNPKRILRFDTATGELTGEFLGNTNYGGGGSFNRYNSDRVFYGRIEHEIDWENNTSRIRNMMSDQIGHQTDIAAIQVEGRTYIANVPLRLGGAPSHITIFLYDEETGTARMVAAFGHAYHFYPARTTEILAMLDGEAPLEFNFIWSDINGNGKVDPDEIRFERADVRPAHAHMAYRSIRLGFIDDQLNCVGSNSVYEVTEILPNGVPLYERREIPFSPIFRFKDGNYFFLHGAYQGNRLENFAVRPDGRKMWGYPVHHPGVGGLNLPQWTPGHVSHQFGSIIGHGTPDEGELGEFVVVHQNTGQWRIWTSDGFLAGEIFQHKFYPGVKIFNSFPESYPGMRLDPITTNQEHFNGYFAKCEQTGRFFAVAGFNHISMIEVKGLDQARRVNLNVQVTEADIARAKEWEEAQEKQVALSQTKKMKAHKFETPPPIDGNIRQGEWPQGETIRNNQIAFNIGYDKDNLYLCWVARGMGRLANSGADFRTYYTTGSAFDLFLGTNPQASANRREPEAGDVRLLITYVNGQPKAVLYQPVAREAKPEEGWQASSQAAGEISFDRVAVLDDAKVGMRQDGRMIVLEAAIPLKSLGIKISDGLTLKMDWGMLVSFDGNAVQQRIYWANQMATGTGDVVAEGRFMPQAWGQVEF